MNKSGVATKRSMPQQGGGTGSVRCALAILRLLAETETPLGVNAIAREVACAPSSCFKILKSLLADEFVTLDGRTKTYSLGCGAIAVARRALDPSRAFAILRPRLEEVAEAYSIAIGLWRMLPNSRMVLIGFVEGSHPMRIHMQVGQRVPRLVGALGRAIAARLDLPIDELARDFEQLRWQNPPKFTDYVKQVEQAKRVGYGVDEGNFATGVKTAAVTIVDEAGIIRYGLSGIMFSGQHDPAATEKIGRALIKIAEWSSERL